MFENIIDKINQGLKERILAFFILWFAIYSTIWTIVEPLQIPIGSDKVRLWRLSFIGITFLISSILYFSFFFKKKLEVFGLELGQTDIMQSLRAYGSPTITTQNDGFHGNILKISADYVLGNIDWTVKASANSATLLTLIYKPEPDLVFYARVSVLSKKKTSSTQKWLRFETSMSLPQSKNDDEEMGIPVTASDDNGLLHVNINLPKTINIAFGIHGWEYDKILFIRSRGSGKIKSIVLK